MIRKLLFPLCILLGGGIYLTACSTNTDAGMERSVIQAKVDSLAAIRIDSANNAINASCTLHFADKVNALADSLVRAAKAHSSK